MLTYDVICPFCGKVNHGLYLEDTDGWMECENCHQLVYRFYAPDKEEKIISSRADDTNRASLLCEVGC